jgi:DNA invertase Pin-like site-specific DNA recombinase
LQQVKPPQRVGGYIRISRIGGRAGDGFISPEQQRSAIELYAASIGAEVPDDAWFRDDDQSGGNLDRQGWEALMEEISSGALDGVIVMQIDRFARNVPDGAAEIRRIVDQQRAYFGSALERMDVSTPDGLYMANQFLNNAELQLNRHKAQWWRSKESAIARGAHIGKTPLGYRRVPKNAPERSGTLFPDPEWTAIIDAVFRRAADQPQHGPKLVAKWADENAVRPDGKRWTGTTVGHVLANRVYLGEVSYRPRDRTKLNFEPMVNESAHEPMVEEEIWAAAQRKPGVQKTNADHLFLLAGLVRCAGCRYRMSPSRGGNNIRVYRCIGDHGAGKCPAPAVVKCERLEGYVLEEVERQYQPQLDVQATPTDSGSAAHEKALGALQTARDEQARFAADARAREILGDDAYYEALESRAQTVREAEALEREHQPDGPFQALSLPSNWQEFSRQELRELLHALADAVYVRRGRLPIEERAYIVWHGELEDDVPTRGRAAGPMRSFAWPADTSK